MLANADLITIGTYIYIKGKQLTTSFSYMGQNVKNVYFVAIWCVCVVCGGGGFNDQTGPILLSSYPLTNIYDHDKYGNNLIIKCYSPI